MKRSLLIGLSSLWLALASQVVSAGVVYNWIELDTNAELGPVTGRIEIKDDVWKSGAYAFEITGPETVSVEDFGLVSVYVNAPGLFGPLVLTDANAIPCREKLSPASCIALGIDPDELVFDTVPLALRGDLVFTDLLAGTFSGNRGGSTNYSFFGNPMSTVEAFNDTGASGGAPCWLLCTARGVWLIDRDTIPVPEPSSLVLLGLGLAGLAFTRRRRQ